VCEDVDWIQLAQVRVQWRGLVHRITNLRFPQGWEIAYQLLLLQLYELGFVTRSNSDLLSEIMNHFDNW
jgi:DNA-binding ferritin-like protein (Dps family)